MTSSSDERAARRSRWIALPALLLVTAAVAIRFAPDAVMFFLRVYGDDMLVAMAAYLLLGAAFPRWPGWKVLLATLILTWGLQVAELFHPAWLGPYWARLRFEWSDIASHTAGALIVFGAERALARSYTNRRPGA